MSPSPPEEEVRPLPRKVLYDLKMEYFGAVFKLDLTDETRTQIARGGGNCLLLPHTGYAYASLYSTVVLYTIKNKKAQLSLTNPRDACEKFARFT